MTVSSFVPRSAAVHNFYFIEASMPRIGLLASGYIGVSAFSGTRLPPPPFPAQE
jgi:hypothetical protein